MNDKQLQGTLKVLITQPGVSVVGPDFLTPHQQFSLPWNIEQGDPSLLSSADMIGDSLGRLPQMSTKASTSFDEEEEDADDPYDFDDGNI